ncbi:MAG: hypothetical protein JSU86_11035 [Phycisphaerales bacterium]|nr:MAG: hypothetical protein JSU86_11035 [Phycisphaerales bacterium]
MMMRARKLRAKYNGTCRNCDGEIRVGDLIYWRRGQGAVHDNCERARLRDSVCPACSGHGCSWNNVPCRCCDGTGSREIYEFAKSGGHPRKLGYEPVSPFVDKVEWPMRPPSTESRLA